MLTLDDHFYYRQHALARWREVKGEIDADVHTEGHASWQSFRVRAKGGASAFRERRRNGAAEEVHSRLLQGGTGGDRIMDGKEIGAFEKYGIDAERWRVAVSFAHVCGGRWTARFELDPRLKRSEGRQLLPDPCV